MRRLAGRLSVAGVVGLFALAFIAWSGWRLWTAASVPVTIDNRSSSTALIRVTDATSGRSIGTYRAGAGMRLQLEPVRLDVWWREMSVQERAAGLESGIRLEVITDRCELLDERVVEYRDEPMTLLDGEGLAIYSTDEPLAQLPGAPGPIPADDPCRGAAPVPLGRIVNGSSSAVLLNGRVRVEGCTELVLRPGELATLPIVEPRAGDLILDSDSIAAQGDRWPVRPRRVVVTDYPGEGPLVNDSNWSAYPGSDGNSGCAALGAAP